MATRSYASRYARDNYYRAAAQQRTTNQGQRIWVSGGKECQECFMFGGHESWCDKTR